jgi:hypothetical protein
LAKGIFNKMYVSDPQMNLGNFNTDALRSRVFFVLFYKIFIIYSYSHFKPLSVFFAYPITIKGNDAIYFVKFSELY